MKYALDYLRRDEDDVREYSSKSLIELIRVWSGLMRDFDIEWWQIYRINTPCSRMLAKSE